MLSSAYHNAYLPHYRYTQPHFHSHQKLVRTLKQQLPITCFPYIQKSWQCLVRPVRVVLLNSSVQHSCKRHHCPLLVLLAHLKHLCVHASLRADALPVPVLKTLIVKFAAFVEDKVGDKENGGVVPKEECKAESAGGVELDAFLGDEFDGEKSGEVDDFEAVVDGFYGGVQNYLLSGS